MTWRESNRTLQILTAAEKGGYGVYTVEHSTAFVQAAQQQSASVPISVHLNHAQDYQQIQHVAENLPFDSIMVDMSHYEKQENIEKTRILRDYCHSRGISVEAETGRIEGGEDGIMDTGNVAGISTNPEDVEEFIAAGVDFLAPNVGNVHGDYGFNGPQLDMNRLQRIVQAMNGRVRLMLHGTNDFSPELIQACIKAGVTKFNVNNLVLNPWHEHLRANATLPLTELMDSGIQVIAREMEHWMDILGSSGRA